MSKESKNDVPIAKPMSDKDVENVMYKVSMADEKVVTPLFTQYVNTMVSIISTAISQSDDEEDIADLTRIKRIINLAPKEELLIRTKDKVWGVRHHIIKKDRDFFFERDYSKMIKQDSNKAFIESLMDIVKNNYDELDQDEQNHYWTKAIELLNLVAKFKKAINER